MDWDTARKYSIVFLILLNVAILGIRVSYSSQYNLTEEKRNAIYFLLQKYQIALEAELPTRFAPMESYTVKINTADTNFYRDIFFTETEQIRRSVEFGKTILKDDSGVLEIANGSVLFSAADTHTGSAVPELLAFDKAAVILYCNRYYEKIKPAFSNLLLSDCIADGDSFIVTYYDNVKGSPFFMSYAEFVITPQGLLSARAQAATLVSASRVKKEICSPDEALLSLIQQRLQADARFETIVSMRVGYAVEDELSAVQDNMKVVPFYYITTDNGLFAINAYNSGN